MTGDLGMVLAGAIVVVLAGEQLIVWLRKRREQ
jgi:hypothetical protein